MTTRVCEPFTALHFLAVALVPLALQRCWQSAVGRAAHVCPLFQVGSLFLYILVGTIGMQMDILAIGRNPGGFLCFPFFVKVQSRSHPKIRSIPELGFRVKRELGLELV